MILARIKLRRLAEPPDLVDAKDLRHEQERRLDEAVLDDVESELDQARRTSAS